MIRSIDQCRICGNERLIALINLGEQVLSGVFPQSMDEPITKGPLELVKCVDDQSNTCGLVQLRHSYEVSEMYGEGYGYRSSLNQSMVEHLRDRVNKALAMAKPNPGDLVVDIGSNDSTALRSYPPSLKLVGIDPIGMKFKSYYPKGITVIADFFAAAKVREHLGGQARAKIITSMAMFYGLESPTDFMRQIHEVLDDEGIWIFEQSYLPTMLKNNSCDTICHEHLEYYALKQISWMTDLVGFKILDVEFNTANGGSFAVTVAKSESRRHQENSALVNAILADEMRQGLSTTKPYEAFQLRIFRQRDQIVEFVKKINAKGQKIFGYGASTKGNVLLQLCGFTKKDIPYIAEVNQDKFGCFTPGTGIPIISEAKAKAMKPDFFLVLPWHFRNSIIEREKNYLQSGGAMVFPLPKIDVVRA